MSKTTNLDLFKHDNPATNTDKFDVDKALNQNWDKIDTAVGNKVDKVSGKGLSTNDYTNAEKQQVATNKSDIANIKTEQTIQNTNIEALQAENEELKTECEALRHDANVSALFKKVEGDNISIDDTVKATLNKVIIKGSCEQDGYPTPENPVEIQVVSGENTVRITNRNLIEVTENLKTTKSAFIGIVKVKFSIIKGEKYIISLDCTNNGGRIYPNEDYFSPADNIAEFYKDCTGSKIVFRVIAKVTRTFTNAALLKTHVATETPYDLSNIKLENGEVATDYEDNEGKTYPLSLGNIELCKIGDYQDYIHGEIDNWYKHKEIQKKEGVGDYIGADVSQGMFVQYNNLVNKKTGALIYSTKQRNYKNFDETWKKYDGSLIGQLYPVDAPKMLYINKQCNTTSQAREFFKDTIIYYPLQTPIEEKITDETLINQLNEIAKATSYNGQTNIIAVSEENLNPILEVEVRKDTNKIISDLTTRIEELESKE